jgi:hypothetical protein
VEYQQLHIDIITYIKFLRDSAEAGQIREGLLANWYLFPEVKQNWLGYSRIGNGGKGLGKVFALALHSNLNTVLSNFGDEEITKSSHLEKICLIKDKVGRDNISDFTTNLINGYLVSYTQEFARSFIDKSYRRTVAIPKVRFNYETRSWVSASYDLPFIDDDYVLLTPKDLLTKDDNWISKNGLIENFPDVVSTLSNNQLRAQINEYFLRLLPDVPKKKDKSNAISQVIRKFPSFIDAYIRYKEDHGDEAVSLSQEQVQAVEMIYVNQLGTFVETLQATTDFYHTGSATYEEAKKRVLFLKDVIENKGGHKLFYDKDIPIRREVDLHIFFRLTWLATPSDVTREANDGRGPVDFKISRGAFDKSLVEFKLASNKKLKQNLEKQTKIYEKASDAPKSLKVIIYFEDAELEKVRKDLEELQLQDSEDIILIDARKSNKPSASNA